VQIHKWSSKTNAMLKSPLPRHFSEKKLRDSYARVAWFYNAWSLLTESKAAAKVLE